MKQTEGLSSDVLALLEHSADRSPAVRPPESARAFALEAVRGAARFERALVGIRERLS